MSDPHEGEPKKVDGEFGGGYGNSKSPDPIRAGEVTDHIEPGEPVVGPQGE
ncbi:hypothetical protein HY950_03930 [Candidatus Gottesmanbacteria bacterium]|nr:hypothetical protein [Candidatus Gottesmanbacteria bacterium]